MFGSRPVWGWLYPYQGSTKVKALKSKSCLVGKDSSCDIVIGKQQVPSLDDYLNLNKQHFKIKRKDDGVFLEDLSRLHTIVNNRSLVFGERVKLRHCDLISVLRNQVKVFVYLENAALEAGQYPDEIKKKYIVAYSLGQGGYGEVNLVFQKESCQRFAMKKVRKNPERLQLIDTEVNILRSLNHPCLIHLEEIHQSPEELYMFLEHMEGGALLSKIHPKKCLADEDVKLIFYQLTLAVQYLHDHNIAHRDIKPENILLASDNPKTLIKLSDFGLSKIEAGTKLTTSIGTPKYTAPEIVNDVNKFSSYTNKVDQWSMGVVLYLCLSGSHPFHTDGSTMNWSCQFLPSVWSRRTVAKDLVQRMLISDPNQRIEVQNILSHPWLQDEAMRMMAHKLMYPGREYKPTPPKDPTPPSSPKQTFFEEVDTRTQNPEQQQRHHFGVRVLPTMPDARRSSPAQTVNLRNQDENFQRSYSLRHSMSPLDKQFQTYNMVQDVTHTVGQTQYFRRSWSLRDPGLPPIPPPKPARLAGNITSVRTSENFDLKSVPSPTLRHQSQLGVLPPPKPIRTSNHYELSPVSTRAPDIPEENSQEHKIDNSVSNLPTTPNQTYSRSQTNKVPPIAPRSVMRRHVESDISSIPQKPVRQPMDFDANHEPELSSQTTAGNKKVENIPSAALLKSIQTPEIHQTFTLPLQQEKLNKSVQMRANQPPMTTSKDIESAKASLVRTSMQGSLKRQAPKPPVKSIKSLN
ncbi:unnamed protein product [Timema podura]|uniref:non-specific serine/threonine protein kinase n=1 Tax=Timema podura TaxID=61482 RepID=A0ABN7NLZ5_TIMPD|nr:unnamed protein product [Timema podura]